MSVKPIKNQKIIFENLKIYFFKKGFKPMHYTGSSDDSYAFGKPIRCYLKYISQRAYKLLKKTVMIVVRQNKVNQNIGILGNDFYGKPCRRVFVNDIRGGSYKKAKELIDTINL